MIVFAWHWTLTLLKGCVLTQPDKVHDILKDTYAGLFPFPKCVVFSYVAFELNDMIIAQTAWNNVVGATVPGRHGVCPQCSLLWPQWGLVTRKEGCEEVGATFILDSQF